MSIERAIQFLKEHEGCRLTAYPDPATGGEPFTIGYGTTGEVKPGQTCTQEQADVWLRERVEQLHHEIQSMVKVPTTDGQMAALISFAYNVGAAALRRSTLLKALNAQGITKAADEFLKWDMAAGKVLPGLVNRRQAERALFLS